MHIAFNGWFWEQPTTGSGQYIRRLVAALREIAPTCGSRCWRRISRRTRMT